MRHELPIVGSLFAATNCLKKLNLLDKLVQRGIVGQLIHNFQNEFFVGQG